MAFEGKSRTRLTFWSLGALFVLVVIVAVVAFLPKPQSEPASDIQKRADAYSKELEAEQAALQEKATARVARPKDRPMRVLYMGDSVTMGSYTSDQSLRWPDLITEALGKGGPVDERVVARGGVTSAQGAADMPTDGPFDLTFLMFGNNDQSRSDLPTFKKTFPALVKKAKALSPKGELVCVSPFLTRQLAREFNTVAQATCEASGGAFVQIGPVAENLTYRAKQGDPYYGGLAPDGGHPNDAGHRAIADTILAHTVVS